MASAKILEVCRVAPPPDSSSPLSLPLTFFDLLWLRFPPVERLYFYEISDISISFDTIVTKLKNSLSLILQHYIPLAGNVTWPQDSNTPIIEFVPGDGVLFIMAESDADFHHLCGSNFCEATECHPLIPEFPASDERTGVMSLQVTLFREGGFCIGIATHHALLDGRTSTAFMKSWARLCKHDGGPLSPATEFPPSYSRTTIADPAGIGAVFLNAWLNRGGPNNRSLMIWDTKIPPGSVRATFELTRQNLQNLRMSIQCRLNKPIHFSTFTLTTAFAWVCLAKAEDLQNRASKFCLVVIADARTRLEPPLPTTYFGNCVIPLRAEAERDAILGENGVIAAAEAIDRAIKSLAGGILDGAEQWISWLLTVNTTEKITGIAGSPRFEVYGVDFGWGKPVKVEMASIGKTEAISVSDSRNGGMEIGLVRRRNVMESFAVHFTTGLEALRSLTNVTLIDKGSNRYI